MTEIRLFPMCLSHELKDLTGVPHRDIPGTDLAIVAGYVGTIDESAERCIHLPDEEIFAAVDRGKPMFRLESMASLLGFGETEEEDGFGTYVLGTESGHFGAAVLGYPEELKKAAEQLREGFYILPCSIHEVILLPDSEAVGVEPGELQQLVAEVNQTQVREDERLSNSIYHFDGERLTSVVGPAVGYEEDENADE